MTTLSIDSSIFEKLKGTEGVNLAALQNLVNAGGRNPALVAMFAQAETRGDVIVRIAEGAELQRLGAGAFFDYSSLRQQDNNKMAIVIDPSWIIGADAQLATSSTGARASVLNVFGHEFDHYMKVDAFKAIDRLQDLSYRPDLSSEQRFEMYATQRMQVEVQGWFTGLQTFRAELASGNTQATISALDQRRLTNVERLLIDVENQGRQSGLTGEALAAFIAEKGAAVLSRNTAYWNTYVEAMSHVQGVDTNAVRQRLAYRLDQPDDVAEWSEQGGDGAPLTLSVRYRNGQRLEETTNPDLTGQYSVWDSNNSLLERTVITVEANGSRTFTAQNAQGAVTSTRNVQTFDDGSYIANTQLPGGSGVEQPAGCGCGKGPAHPGAFRGGKKRYDLEGCGMNFMSLGTFVHDVVAGSVRVGRTTKCRRLLSMFGFMLLGANASAQPGVPTPPSALPRDFEYQLYDKAAPTLPEDYPAKRYSSEDLLRRLAEMANAPEVKREEIEEEFGLKFVATATGNRELWAARGRFPLGSNLSRYSDYRMGSSLGTIALNLQLVDSVKGPFGERTDYGGRPKLCVDVVNLYQSLGPGWEKVTHGIGSHYPLSIYLIKTIEGRKRQVQVAPPSLVEGVCARSYSLTYDVE